MPLHIFLHRPVLVKKIYIIAGEASGDLHGANLIRAMLAERTDLDIRAWGGDLMEEAGATIVKNYKELAFMGFQEVLLNIRTILGNIDKCKQDILEFKPDCIVYIDYPGFNMRIARWAKQQGFNNHYYIAPQAWAWKKNRVHDLRRDLERLYCILPFEKEFFEKANVPTTYVGHPLLDAINRDVLKTNYEPSSAKPIVALLPGSRTQEIKSMLPIMLEATKHFTDHHFVIAGAPGKSRDDYHLENYPDVEIVFGRTYGILKHAKAALVTSGTATLETALFGVPQVVCYKTSPVSYRIAKLLVRSIKYISLVNLILDRLAVPELIQSDLKLKRVKQELANILSGEGREKQLTSYKQLNDRLSVGGASVTTAKAMLKTLDEGQ